MELLNQEVPPLRGDIDSETLNRLRSYKEEMILLIQRIVTKKIGNKLERSMSEYMTEELRNSRIRTIKKILLEQEPRELKELFSS